MSMIDVITVAGAKCLIMFKLLPIYSSEHIWEANKNLKTRFLDLLKSYL